MLYTTARRHDLISWQTCAWILARVLVHRLWQKFVPKFKTSEFHLIPGCTKLGARFCENKKPSYVGGKPPCCKSFLNTTFPTLCLCFDFNLLQQAWDEKPKPIPPFVEHCAHWWEPWLPLHACQGYNINKIDNRRAPSYSVRLVCISQTWGHVPRGLLRTAYSGVCLQFQNWSTFGSHCTLPPTL